MPTYINGRIPAELLIVFDSGTDSEGYWEHALSPATLARHRALVKLALKHTGRDLRLGPGWRCYRPYAQQVRAREIHGNWAAVPGTSSHGGTFEGQQTLAMDYGWWDWVYEKFGANKRAVWYADCRAVGLTPGLIEPRRGYPDEPWHVVDENPWVMPSYASTDVKPLPTTTPTIPEPEPEEEDEDMCKNSGFRYERAADKKTVNLIVNTSRGWWFEYLGGHTVPVDSNNAVAATLGTDSYAEVSEAFAKALKASLPRAQGVIVSGELTIADDA